MPVGAAREAGTRPPRDGRDESVVVSFGSGSADPGGVTRRSSRGGREVGSFLSRLKLALRL
jgi:hypothetical protein